jgi:hypothetical protein
MQNNPHRQQQIYWEQLVELKVASVGIRLYQNYLGRRESVISSIRAVASSGGIAGWAIWHEYAFIWGVIIAMSQVIDALKDVFPFAQRLKSASDLRVILERLCIDAQFEWESIYASNLNTDQINEACRRLRVSQLDAESKSFPNGFPLHPRLLALAREETTAYFSARYNVEVG